MLVPSHIFHFTESRGHAEWFPSVVYVNTLYDALWWNLVTMHFSECHYICFYLLKLTYRIRRNNSQGCVCFKNIKNNHWGKYLGKMGWKKIRLRFRELDLLSGILCIPCICWGTLKSCAGHIGEHYTCLHPSTWGTWKKSFCVQDSSKERTLNQRINNNGTILPMQGR